MCRCVTTTLSAQLTFHPESGALHWTLTRQHDGELIQIYADRQLAAWLATPVFVPELVALVLQELPALEGRAPLPFCD